MKQLLYLLVGVVSCANAQTLTLERAIELARNNYPLIKQKDLITKTKDISLENIQTAFYPQVTINGQATYQSDITNIKIPNSPVVIQPLSKDQYRITADVNQTLYDGGIVKQQKNMQQLAAEVDANKLEVDLYNINQRISQVYLSVLLTDEQLQQTELIKKDLRSGITKVEAQVQNGVAFRSNLNVLKAELIKTDQRSIELTTTRQGLLDVLGLMTGELYTEKTLLQKPALVVENDELQRPEMQLFQSQQKLLDGQQKLVHSKNIPKAGLFFQGGYGKPGLNLLENKFSLFYVTGLRLNWNLGNLYTQKREAEILDINKKTVGLQQETFLQSISIQKKQQQAELKKYQLLIEKDKEIIDLRILVKEAAKAQLDNGVINANDFLREVNAEDQARQMLILHQLQQIQAMVNYKLINGK